MAESIVEILIKFGLDPSKAQEAQKEIDRLKDKTVEAGKEGEKFSGIERGIHQTLHLIGHESGPAAGAALAGLVAAGTGSFSILALGIRETVEGIQTLREESEKAKEAIEDIGIAADNAAAKAADLHAKFLQQQAEQKEAVDKVKEAYEHQNTVLNSVSEAHKKILEDMEKEEMAAAKGDKAKEEEIRKRFSQQQFDLETATGQQRIDLLTKYVDQLKAKQPDLEKSAKLIAGDVEYLTANTGAPAGFAIDDKREAALKVAAKDAQAFLQRVLTGNTTLAEKVVGYDPHTAAVDAANAEKSLADYQRNKAALLAYNASLEREKAELDKTTAARDNNAKEIEEQTQLLANEKAKFAAQLSGDLISRAVSLSRSGGNLNAADSEFVQSIGSMVAGQSVSLKGAEQIFIHLKNVDNFIGRLSNLIQNMPDPRKFEQRIEALESRGNRAFQ